MDSGLKSKTVIVTGGSGGIGQEIVRQFVTEGANVVIHYFHGQDRAEKLAAEFSPTQVKTVCADLRVEDSVAKLFDETEARFESADILIANAGVWPVTHTPIRTMTLERWNDTVATDLTSVFLCIREFLKRSERLGLLDPSIVMIGSTAGHFGEAGHADYAASKSGLMHGLLASLKNEIIEAAPRGRINAVCPGWTLTSMARKLTGDSEAMIRALQTIPLQKFGNPKDVASAVLFLSSNLLAGHITGQSIFVSGGMEGRVLHSPDEIELETAIPSPKQ